MIGNDEDESDTDLDDDRRKDIEKGNDLMQESISENTKKKYAQKLKSFKKICYQKISGAY
jgi:hypothetical protein